MACRPWTSHPVHLTNIAKRSSCSMTRTCRSSEVNNEATGLNKTENDQGTKYVAANEDTEINADLTKTAVSYKC